MHTHSILRCRKEIYSLQVERLHLGIGMVHKFHADMVRPTGASWYGG